MSIEDCPDCRKLQSECETLEREVRIIAKQYADATAVIGCLEKKLERCEPDPRSPALERELKLARIDLDNAKAHWENDRAAQELRHDLCVRAHTEGCRRGKPTDPRSPKPVYVPAAVPKKQTEPAPDRWCCVCNAYHA